MEHAAIPDMSLNQPAGDSFIWAKQSDTSLRP